MNDMGPATLRRLKAIQDNLERKVEEAGRGLGIPEDRSTLIEILKIDRQEQWEAETRKWREDLEKRTRDAEYDKWHLLRNLARFIDGLLDRRIGK